MKIKHTQINPKDKTRTQLANYVFMDSCTAFKSVSEAFGEDGVCVHDLASVAFANDFDDAHQGWGDVDIALHLYFGRIEGLGKENRSLPPVLVFGLTYFVGKSPREALKECVVVEITDPTEVVSTEKHQKNKNNHLHSFFAKDPQGNCFKFTIEKDESKWGIGFEVTTEGKTFKRVLLSKEATFFPGVSGNLGMFCNMFDQQIDQHARSFLTYQIRSGEASNEHGAG